MPALDFSVLNLYRKSSGGSVNCVTFPSLPQSVVFHKFILLAALAGLAQVAAAQPARPAAAPASPWQVAVQGRYQHYNGLAQSGSGNRTADVSDDGAATLAGPQLVLARAFTPRLALETGFAIAYSGWHTLLLRSFFFPEYAEPSKYQLCSTTWSVPLRLRYALCPPGHRLGAYLLAGAELLQQNVRYRPEPGTANPDPALTGWSIHRDVPLAAGLGLRYALAPRWSLSADGQATVSTRFVFDNTYLGTNTLRPGLGGAVGVSYGF